MEMAFCSFNSEKHFRFTSSIAKRLECQNHIQSLTKAPPGSAISFWKPAVKNLPLKLSLKTTSPATPRHIITANDLGKSGEEKVLLIHRAPKTEFD